jgi:hypothetical protein
LLQVLVFPPTADPRLYDVAVLIAIYSVVKYGRRRRHRLLTAVPVVIGVVIEVARHVNRAEAAANPVRIWGESIAHLLAVCAGV